jgi:hypothetical protein
MMKRAGYIQLNRRPVLCDEGMPLEILELHIYGTRLCIRIKELREAMYYGAVAMVERLQWNWMTFIGARAGMAQVSRSGKALNIELANGERFTVALDSLQDVLACREKFASVAALPFRFREEKSHDRRITDYCAMPSCTNPTDHRDGIPA